MPLPDLSHEKATKAEIGKGKGSGGAGHVVVKMPLVEAERSPVQQVVPEPQHTSEPAAAKKSGVKAAVKTSAKKPEPAVTNAIEAIEGGRGPEIPSRGDGLAVKADPESTATACKPPVIETPTSVRQDRIVAQARDENLRRASTAQQLREQERILLQRANAEAEGDEARGGTPPFGEEAPESAPGTHAKEDVGEETNDNDTGTKDDGKSGVAPVSKRRREKTEQEKANHARFMRFSRSISSF